MPAEPPEESLATPQIVAQLVANHREFLAFVQKRVGNAALAEEILQDAFVRSLGKLDTINDTAVGWFYRVLRNAIIDHHRRTAAAERRHEAAALEPIDDTDDELHRVVCKCVGQLADTLKRVRERAAPDRCRWRAGQGLRRRGGHLREQRRRPRVPRARGAAQAGRALVRHLRHARLPRLQLRDCKALRTWMMPDLAAMPR